MSVGLYSGVSGLALGIGLYRNVSGLWGGASGLIDGFGGADPYAGASLYLNFLDPVLDSRITFSRGTNATLIDSTGRLTYAPNNIITWSEDFANATWAPVNCTKTTGQIDPNGGMTACRLTATADFGQIFRTYGATLTGNAINSIYIRRVTGSGTVWLFSPAVGLTVLTVTNAWTRVDTGSVAISGTGSTGIRLAVSGDAVDVAFAQTELVTYQTTPSTYVATTASAYYGPRFDYDPVTLAPRGLLIEEARTNLALYSDDFGNAAWAKTAATITANATSSPDGTTNADKLVATAVTSGHFVSQAVTITASTNYTVSVYVKAAEYSWAIIYVGTVGVGQYVNLATGAVGSTFIGAPTSTTVTNAGNGWRRVNMVFSSGANTSADVRVYATTADGTSSYLGDGTSGIYIYGAQLEAGSFATSYIPTVASTVTRNADNAVMTGTNFSSWYNQSEGTFVIDSAYSPVSGASFGLACAFQGASNFININNNGNRALYVFVGGVNQVDLSPGGYVAYAPAKIASAYKVDDFATTINARTVLTDTSGTLPVPTSFRIGRDAQDLYINNHIRTIAYFNTRLPNAQLQTLTAPSLATTLSLDFTSGSYNVGF